MATPPKTSGSSKGYRSLKRALGETNLERKCRWLFGICLLALISAAFWSADRIAEDLVRDNIANSGMDWVRTYLFEKHWAAWDTTTDPAGQLLRRKLSSSLIGNKHEAKVIALDRAFVTHLEQQNANRSSERVGSEFTGPRLVPPQNAEEEDLLLQLKQEFEQQLATAAAAKAEGKRREEQPDAPLAALEDGAQSHEVLQPVFKLRSSPDGGYYVYQPVHWEADSFCITCHEGSYGRYAVSAADASVTGDSLLPFLVIRVTLDSSETLAAVNFTRAVLMAIGILTVSLSMIALWLVVRYVVVKPLNHLRDVSDAVTRGDLETRADIHTNDEFEELAASFNKMLRHLMDSQGELRDLNINLDAKVDELAQLNMRLNEMNRVKGEFLASMSHELRTPLNSILGFSQVLEGIDSLPDKQKRYVQNIQNSGRKLLEMINDILDVAKMEAGKMEVRPGEFRIDAIVSAQCDLVRSLADDKNIDLRMEVDADLPVMYQDQAKVQQILTNLLSNAIKFTPEGGRIVVRARPDGRGFVELSVTDTGVGIAESDRELIFEKFRQGAAVLGHDNWTREYSGTGLGLSIVKELCKLLGGEVSVESELGKGSTFRVLIPWMRADQPTAAAKMNARIDDLTRPRRVDFQRDPSDSFVAGTISSAGAESES
jgi:signal transduction histidine kinase